MTMQYMMKSLAGLLIALSLMFGGIASAQADALDTYRSNGTIAERYDGYLELRGSGAPADAKSLVSSVNSKRKALYEKRAREQNVPVSAVGALFAGKIAEQGAPSGTYFRMQDGSYKRN
jgi:uncharacterized protein YdbL (DUF1318 family)